MKYSYVYVFFLVFLFVSCENHGYLSLTNGYEHDVVVHTPYDHNGDTFGQTDVFFSGYRYYMSGNRREYEHIIAVRIETLDGTVLAEYTPEYFLYLRKIYGIKKKQVERWILTEKGLFLETREISNRYVQDIRKIIEYYRSDEAVQDLQAMLEAVE